MWAIAITWRPSSSVVVCRRPSSSSLTFLWKSSPPKGLKGIALKLWTLHLWDVLYQDYTNGDRRPNNMTAVTKNRPGGSDYCFWLVNQKVKEIDEIWCHATASASKALQKSPLSRSCQMSPYRSYGPLKVKNSIFSCFWPIEWKLLQIEKSCCLLKCSAHLALQKSP